MGGIVSRVFRALFSDGFIPRLIRAFVNSRSVDAQNSWDALMNHLEDHVREDYIRMNLVFDGEEPALDNVEQMHNLPRQVRSQLESHNDCAKAARMLEAALFCFELDKKADYGLGTFRCHGAILCRVFPSSSLVRKLQTIYPTARFMLNEDFVLGDVSMKYCCGNCGFFRIDVTFDVRHRAESIDIFLVYNKLFKRHINGFPGPVSWFEQAQGFNDAFGITDHPLTSGPRKCSCASVVGKKKRKVHFAGESPSKWRAL
jgi:hypothetical protein